MYIKEVNLYNFRIYKGTNLIDLSTTSDKNIVVISGKNGFGKTTFLMSLVWCLYGKQMQNVDQLYKKEIVDKGGYTKYITNSLNRLAKANGETKFSVSITFKDVKIPEITCNEVKITRSYNIVTSSNDKVEVLIDNFKNELIEDLTTDGKQNGEEVFIRDFILPIEIAKFFFFDAEKIVSLAEINSPKQRILLSRAYTEVLGIKKYEDLKDQLESIQDEYRNKSANLKEKIEWNQIITDIRNLYIQIDEFEQEIQVLNEEKIEKSSESSDIQRKLIQEGNLMTLDRLNELKKQEKILASEIKNLQDRLKELFDLIPFGLAGQNLILVNQQLLKEKNYNENKYVQEDVGEKTKKILDDIEVQKKSFPSVIPIDIRNFYEEQITLLVKKHFFKDIPEIPTNFQLLHDFSDTEVKELKVLLDRLRLSFKEQFRNMNGEYSKTKSQLDSIRRKIRDAEKDADDEYISNLRDSKERNDKRVLDIEDEIYDIKENIGELKNKVKTRKKRQEELRKKIDDSRKYGEKDKKVQDIINYLKIFIKSFKEEKKKSLENNILSELNTLMHKKGFIKHVSVDINQSGDDVDINLYNDRKEKIDKGSLSMGERQIYASALLKALVDESDIEFPVFIDSPMQKFDREHAKNVIKEFYPNVSKQVVLFPLLHKELNSNEYELLEKNVIKSYIIDNCSTDASKFLSSEPNHLIETYDKLYAD